MEPARVTEFSGSLTRCMSNAAFLDRFYELFLASSPEVTAKFRQTDFERQKRALSSSLYVMVMAVEGGDAAQAYLDRIARQHGRRHLDIRPALYDQWLDCLIQAVREHDPEFTDETETLWREVMRFGIDYLTDRY